MFHLAAGVVDEDYRGLIKVILFNHSDTPFEVRKGDRIAQLICEQIYYPELQEAQVLFNPLSRIFHLTDSAFQELTDTERGEGGFGSTGTNQMSAKPLLSVCIFCLCLVGSVLSWRTKKVQVSKIDFHNNNSLMTLSCSGVALIRPRVNSAEICHSNQLTLPLPVSSITLSLFCNCKQYPTGTLIQLLVICAVFMLAFNE